MGVEIIFDRKAYRIDGEDIKEAKIEDLKNKTDSDEITEEEFREELNRLIRRNEEDKYLLLCYHGSNNCFNQDGSIAKDWSIMAYGDKTEVMKRIISISTDFESGMVRYSNGRGKPETYIKSWRKKVNNAKDFEEFFEDFRRIETRFRFLNESDKEKLEDWELELMEGDGWEENRNFGMYDSVYSKPVESLSDFREYRELKERMENKPPVMIIR